MNKQETKTVIPKLRFPRFRDGGAWPCLNGDLLFDQISNKNHNSDLPILAITQEHGAIPRSEIDYHVSVTDKSVESYKVVEVGDFIISLRSFQGGIEYSKYRGLCSPAYIVLRKKNDEVNDFFKHYFKTRMFIISLNKNIEGIRDGKMVSYKQFSDLLLPKPSPAEQQKIADCLTSVDDLIIAQSQKLDNLKAHKKGLTERLFPNEGEIVPKLRFSEFRDAGEWKTKKICEFAKVTTGSKDTQNKVENGLFPFFVRSQTIERIDSFSHEGEAILTSGDGVGVGKNFHYINGKFDFHQRVYCIFDFSKNISGKFVYLYFSEHFYKRVMKLSAKNSVDSVRMSMITEMPILLPKLEEQKKIAACLSSIDDLITAQSEKVDALKNHKKGLTQQLFPSIDND